MKKRLLWTMVALALLAQAAGVAGESARDAVAGIAGYRFGDSREALSAVEDLARAALSDNALRESLAAELAALLAGEATYESKDFACRQMAIIGGPAAVPALATLLRAPDTADMARYALQVIPCPEATQALMDALGKAAAPVQIGIINSLGERRDAAAVPALAAYATGLDPAPAEAAIHALGKIGGAAAMDALLMAQRSALQQLQRAASDALIGCGEQLLAAGDMDRAAAVFTPLFAETHPAPVRVAAFRGLVAAKKDAGLGLVIDALKGKDAALYGPAVAAFPCYPCAEATEAVANAIDQMPPRAQEMALTALQARGDAAGKAPVMALAQSGNPDVRIAALGALGALGGAEAIPLLVEAAVNNDGRERLAARSSLSALHGPGVDDAILRGIRRGKPTLRVEYIRTASERGLGDAKPHLFRAAKARNTDVKYAACRALVSLVDAGDLDAALALVRAAKKDVDLAEAAKVAAAAAAREDDASARAAALNAALGRVKKDNQKAAIQRMLDAPVQ